jgi:hypothetical protein
MFDDDELFEEDVVPELNPDEDLKWGDSSEDVIESTDIGVSDYD